ncbi:MAG: c-type cytochrome biogenesis protein CcmI, partial [Pseudomonadales bacterium]|nr:c-type cytochrome biogenesis protein CcmI [Pseudomonadales bacterium]
MIWLGAALLLSAAVLLLGIALLRQPARGEGPSRQATTTALYRDRLDELEQDLATGTLAATDRDLVTEELNRSLLDDYAEEERSGGDRIAPWIALFAALCLVAGSLGLYTLIGDPAADSLRGAERLLQLDAEADRQALLEWQEQLQRRVESRAGDAKSWYLLGHTHLKLGNYQAAAEDFA